jgi:hypothetical protein
MNGEPAELAANSSGKRQLIGLVWGLTQLVILCVLFFAGGVAGGYLGTDVLSGHGTNGLVVTGFAVGVIAALAVNHNARIWLQRLRLRGLRARGVAVEAEVVNFNRSYTPSTRGPGSTRYVVLAGWTDPATGAGWQGERLYRFSGRGSRRLERACADGAKVPVYYPAGRPSRFIIDIPYAPTMADFFM